MAKTVKQIFECPEINPVYDQRINALAVRNRHTLVPLVDNDTYIGIEVEVERVFTNNNLTSIGDAYLWNNTEDNSLRNNGREFVSLPVKGTNVEFALSKLRDTLTKSKTCLGHEFTDRTSVHIHMDCQGLVDEDVAKITLVYFLVEPLLYNFAGGDRQKNIFCVPINETNLTEHLANYFCKKICSFLDLVSSWSKYAGLNLIPLARYGTIEFRHMAGTIDVTRLVTWINMLLSIRQYALKNSLDSLLNRFVDLNTSSEYSQVIYDIFGENAYILQDENTRFYLEKSCRFIKDIKNYTSATRELLDLLAGTFDKKSNVCQTAKKLDFIYAEKTNLQRLTEQLERANKELSTAKLTNAQKAEYLTLIKDLQIAIDKEKRKEYEKITSATLQEGGAFNQVFAGINHAQLAGGWNINDLQAQAVARNR